MKIDKTQQVSSFEQVQQDYQLSHLKAKEPQKEPKETKESIQLSRDAASELKKPSKTSKSEETKPVKDETPQKKKWTVLIYFAADNDLEPYETKNLVDLEKVGSTKDTNIVAQIDRGPTPTTRFGGNTDATRYYVLKDKVVNEKIDSKELKHLGKVDSATPEVLKDFLAWGMKSYPADNYLVILNDHGAGFAGALQDVEKDSFMDIPNIKKALKEAETETGIPKDNIILGFDACLMGQTEVAYELRNVANIMIASEEAIGGNGWPYEGILKNNKFDKIKSSYSGPEAMKRMAEHIIDESKKTQKSTFTMSAIDLTKMNKVKDAIDGLGKALLKTDEPLSRIRRIIQLSQHYTSGFEERPFSEMRDIYDLAERLSRSKVVNDTKLQQAAIKVMKSIEDAVIKEQHQKEDVGDSHGLSIYAPITKGGYDGFNYDRLELAKDTSWDEAMIKFTGEPVKPKPGGGWTYSPPKGKGKIDKVK